MAATIRVRVNARPGQAAAPGQPPQPPIASGSQAEEVFASVLKKITDTLSQSYNDLQQREKLFSGGMLAALDMGDDPEKIRDALGQMWQKFAEISKLMDDGLVQQAATALRIKNVASAADKAAQDLERTVKEREGITKGVPFNRIAEVFAELSQVAKPGRRRRLAHDASDEQIEKMVRMPEEREAPGLLDRIARAAFARFAYQHPFLAGLAGSAFGGGAAGGPGGGGGAGGAAGGFFNMTPFGKIIGTTLEFARVLDAATRAVGEFIKTFGRLGTGIAAMNPEAVARAIPDLLSKIPIIGNILGPLASLPLDINNAIFGSIQKLAQYNPMLAQQLAMHEVHNLMRDMRRAQEMGPQMMRALDARQRFEDKFNEFIDRNMDNIVKLMESGLATLQDMIPLLHGFIGAMQVILNPADAIAVALGGPVAVALSQIASNTTPPPNFEQAMEIFDQLLNQTPPPPPPP